ncbi:hypothetical protein SAMN05518847_1011 [Paenibacillus sp. OV219]|nr:hypothetical protein SAMN05518847_1011 [Paenibacillus sp. OV219]
MKKKSTYIIILLSFFLVILSFKCIESQSQRRELQKSIDTSFRYQLGNVLGSFGMQVMIIRTDR